MNDGQIFIIDGHALLGYRDSAETCLSYREGYENGLSDGMLATQAERDAFLAKHYATIRALDEQESQKESAHDDR